uniref:Uncharacterized protein n=1 Tax=Eutreptiella gymnastica TaxID=73025 RepID=A0A7S4LK54_9EUGL
MKSDADDPVTGAEGAGFFFKASTILNAWPSRTPHFLSAAILIRVSSFMHANPAAASGTAYCEYPSCCKKFTRSALGFTTAPAAALVAAKIGASTVEDDKFVHGKAVKNRQHVQGVQRIASTLPPKDKKHVAHCD